MEPEDRIDFAALASRLESVCLILGPYRNLTTLTASILMLHPQCQVLNHAGRGLLTSRVDFIDNYGDERLNRFCARALRASTGGERRVGGSILLSHAFDREPLPTLYSARYGKSLMKADPACLVWKESQLVTNRIRYTQSPLLKFLGRFPRWSYLAQSRSRLLAAQVRPSPQKIERLLEQAPRIRFVMPVRNPIESAMSNVRTGHARWIMHADPASPTDVLDKIVESVAWFSRLAAARPDRFFMYFEDDTPDEVCAGLTQVLGLADDSEWRAAVDQVFKVQGKKQYETDESMNSALERSIDSYCADLPVVASRIRGLVSGNPRSEVS